MRSVVLHLTVCLLPLALFGREGAAATPLAVRQGAVERLLRTVAQELVDPSDAAAIDELIAVFTAQGSLSEAEPTAWMVLTFDHEGTLTAVQVNATALLEAPPLIQRAAVLHELEHLKRARETRRLLQDGGGRGVARLHHIVRVLVEDECRAYRRDILYVEGAISVQGGLEAYLAIRPPGERAPTRRYHAQHVAPFLATDGTINERRLRDFVFLETFPRRHPRQYTAALMWETLQGHIEVRRASDGVWRPARLLSPGAFLAWLVPLTILP